MISGYVYQDGPAIKTADGLAPQNIRDFRDGLRTADDTPIAGVRLQLRSLNGLPFESERALPGYYTGRFIEVVTDANGYFEFKGLRESTYHIFQLQPTGYIDSLDTPGTTGGLSVNKGDIVGSSIRDPFLEDIIAQSNFDGLLMISVLPGGTSQLNNFSEIVVTKDPPPVPPLPPNPPELRVPTPEPPLYAPMAPIAWQPLLWTPLPVVPNLGLDSDPTWHLSVINGGFPRGRRTGEPIDESEVAQRAERLDVYAWTVRGMKESTWKIVSLNNNTNNVDAKPLPLSSRIVFDLPDAQPLAGDFNGDGYDEIALFVNGEWFVDLNGNGRWMKRTYG